MSGVVLEDFILFLLCEFLGVLGGERPRSAASTSSDKSSSWLSESTWAPADTSTGTKPAVWVMCTLRAAPRRSAAERLNSGYTPVNKTVITLRNTANNNQLNYHTINHFLPLRASFCLGVFAREDRSTNAEPTSRSVSLGLWVLSFLKATHT